MNSELDYFKFYKTPEKEVYALLGQQILVYRESTLREIKMLLPKIIKCRLITIESYSADFMKAYGNEQNITPFLDSLATKVYFFTNFMLQEIEQCEV
jgi:hypothetical protein